MFDRDRTQAFECFGASADLCFVAEVYQGAVPPLFCVTLHPCNEVFGPHEHTRSCACSGHQPNAAPSDQWRFGGSAEQGPSTATGEWLLGAGVAKSGSAFMQSSTSGTAQK